MFPASGEPETSRGWGSCSVSCEQRLITSQQPLLLPKQFSVHDTQPPSPPVLRPHCSGLGYIWKTLPPPPGDHDVGLGPARGAGAAPARGQAGGQEGRRLGAQSAAPHPPTAMWPGLLQDPCWLPYL